MIDSNTIINESSNIMYFGSYLAMILAISLAIFLLIRSNFKKVTKDEDKSDMLYRQTLKIDDKELLWGILCEHIKSGNATRLRFVIDTYTSNTDAFIKEEYQPLKTRHRRQCPGKNQPGKERGT